MREGPRKIPMPSNALTALPDSGPAIAHADGIEGEGVTTSFRKAAPAFHAQPGVTSYPFILGAKDAPARTREADFRVQAVTIHWPNRKSGWGWNEWRGRCWEGWADLPLCSNAFPWRADEEKTQAESQRNKNKAQAPPPNNAKKQRV
jgi:hypothetical protein